MDQYDELKGEKIPATISDFNLEVWTNKKVTDCPKCPKQVYTEKLYSY